MNYYPHGYGIYRYPNGDVYYGEYKQKQREGQGYKKWPNGNEYCGEYKNDMKWGDGVKKENGQLYSVKYDEEGTCIYRRKISEGS